MTKSIARKRHSIVFILISIPLFLGFCVGAIFGTQVLTEKEANWFKLVKVDEEIFDVLREQNKTQQKALEAYMDLDSDGIKESAKNLEKQTEQMIELGNRRSELQRILGI